MGHALHCSTSVVSVDTNDFEVTVLMYMLRTRENTSNIFQHGTSS